MGKLNQAICPPGSIKMSEGSMRTDGVKKGSHARGGPLAKISVPAGSASGGIPNPDQKPNSGLRGQPIGQKVPDTGAVATKKPKTRAALAFYGE